MGPWHFVAAMFLDLEINLPWCQPRTISSSYQQQCILDILQKKLSQAQNIYHTSFMTESESLCTHWLIWFGSHKTLRNVTWYGRQVLVSYWRSPRSTYNNPVKLHNGCPLLLFDRNWPCFNVITRSYFIRETWFTRTIRLIMLFHVITRSR